MSFHPSMVYGRELPQVGARSSPKKARRSRSRRRAARSSTRSARAYPPEQKRSAMLAALYLAQDQQGYLTAQRRCGTSPAILDLTPAEVEDVVTYYVMFYTRAGRQVRAAGLPDAVVRADGRRARDRGAVGEARHRAPARPTRPASSRCSRSSAWAPATARRSSMVNNEHWHERQKPEDVGATARCDEHHRRTRCESGASTRAAHLRASERAERD